MASVVQGEFTFKNEQARQVFILNSYKMLRPWIKKIECLDDDGTTVEFETDAENAILQTLDVTQQESGNLVETIRKFIEETKLTYICYSGIECPACGKTPGENLKDYYPVDVMYLFFCLCCRRLVLAGMS